MEIRLQQLAALERQKIEDEYKEKKKLILWLEDVLAHPKKILSIIKNELSDLKEKYGDERRTKIKKQTLGSFSDEDLIPNEDVIVTLTKGNYIKRIPIATYRSQRRGGKGVVGMTTKEEDVVEHLLSAKTHDDILFFTNTGRAFVLKVYELSSASRVAKGQAIVNLLQLAPDEDITSVINLSLKDKIEYLIMATKAGMIKKTKLEDFANIRKSGLIAIRLKKGDELKWVKPTFGNDEIMLVTSNGQSIKFKESDVRPMSRGTMGVRGIRLRKGDFVVGMDIVTFKKESLEKPKKTKGRRKKPIRDVFVIMENGYGKRTDVNFYHLQRRGGVGIKTAQITPKTGKIVEMKFITSDAKDLVIVSAHGQVIRMPIKSVSRIGRATQGVRLIRLNTGDKVASITCIKEKCEEEEKERKS